LNYHPSDPTPAEIAAGFTAGNDFEYVELQNIGASAVDLTGCSFTAGVGFAFTPALSPAVLRLDPGERVVIAENPEAFAMRYGVNSSLKLAGPYSGNLSNSGDTLTFVAANAGVIKSFTFDDDEPWPVDADGAGYSLVLNNPGTNPDHNLAASWRSSAQIGGSPGGANGVPPPANPLADNDGDGLSAIVEHALGLQLSVADASPVMATAEQQFIVNNVPGNYLVIEFQRSLFAEGVTVIPEMSTTLASNSWQAGALVYVGSHNNGNGTATVTYRSSAPVTPSSRMFLRLRVQ
jgi:hypothetical protein